MHLDRDSGQPTPSEHIIGSGNDHQPSPAPDNQLLQASNSTRVLIIDKPITRESLIEQHELAPNDPEISSLLGRILDLRDIARITNFLPAIAAKHIAAFKSARQNGNGQTPIEEPE